MIIDDVYTFLGAETSLTCGTNLFKSRQTDSPNDQVVVYDTGGFEPDHYLPTAKPTFQVLVRSTSYATGAGYVDEIVEALHQLANVTLVTHSIYFYYIFLMNEPSHIGRDDKGRHEFSINFVCEIRR
jgi:hypothetical protein